jgi:hypothetical protein
MAKKFLGSGWKFPVQLDDRNGVARSSEAEDIEEAIRIILSTAPGERVMRPEFGCGINDYVFSVVNTTTLTQIKNAVERALALYEPRIRVESVTAEADETRSGHLLIGIDYTVRTSNSRHNMVYPFYLTEKG